MLIFVETTTSKSKAMKTAEFLLRYMDELQRIVGVINDWVDKASEFFLKVKEWIVKVVEWIEQAVDVLVQQVGGRKSTSHLMSDDYLFV
jgi:hypothetical protein